MKHRNRLFDAQKKALNSFGIEGDICACPICLTIFGRDAVTDQRLTEEHVPPKSLGGRKLLLTCKNCNNTTGSKLEADLAKREEVHRNAAFFAQTEEGDVGAAQIRAGNAKINVQIGKKNGLHNLKVPERHNNPLAIREFEMFLKSMKKGSSMEVELQPRVWTH